MLQGKWLLKHRFVHDQQTKTEIRKHTQCYLFKLKTKKRVEFLFIYRPGDLVKKLVMISSIPPDTKRLGPFFLFCVASRPHVGVLLSPEHSALSSKRFLRSYTCGFLHCLIWSLSAVRRLWLSEAPQDRFRGFRRQRRGRDICGGSVEVSRRQGAVKHGDATSEKRAWKQRHTNKDARKLLCDGVFPSQFCWCFGFCGTLKPPFARTRALPSRKWEGMEDLQVQYF